MYRLAIGPLQPLHVLGMQQREGAIFDDEDAKRGAYINRSDVAQGLLRIAGMDLLDDKDTLAPYFVYATRMQDKTSLGMNIQSCMWALHTTLCMAHAGILSTPYLNQQGRLRCILPLTKGKL